MTDNALRAAASDSMKDSLGLLTNFIAQKLNSRVSNELGVVTIWSIPNANNVSRNSTISSFLRCPCLKVMDWQVRKSDHSGFLQDLRPLVNAGEIRAESYQPGGRGLYHFKITKLKSRTVPIASVVGLSCSCPTARYSSYRSYQQNSTPCLLKQCKASTSKYRDDSNKLAVVRALLTPAQQSKLVGSRKRATNPYASSSAASVGPNPYSSTAGTRTINPYSTANAANPYPSSFAGAAGNIGPSISAIGQLHSQQAAKKQKKSPEVIDLDDDDVCIEEVVGAEQAIRKRVKEAEDKGEIVEIN